MREHPFRIQIRQTCDPCRVIGPGSREVDQPLLATFMTHTHSACKIDAPHFHRMVDELQTEVWAVLRQGAGSLRLHFTGLLLTVSHSMFLWDVENATSTTTSNIGQGHTWKQ